MIEKHPSPNRGKALVTFRLEPSTWADQVTLLAEFDGLNLTAFPMRTSPADPGWHITLELDTGQCYRFAYLVDGRQWSTDYRADGYEVDGRGRPWSVLLVLPQDSGAGQDAVPASVPVTAVSADKADEPVGSWQAASVLERV